MQRLVTNLFKATTPKGSQSNDPFWDTAASMLLLALVFFLKYEAPEEEQNFPDGNGNVTCRRSQRGR